MRAVSPTARPGKGSLLPCVQQRPAGAALVAALSVALIRSAVLAASTRNPARGAIGEEPMTLTTIILLINAVAQLAASLAQLVRVLRGRRR